MQTIKHKDGRPFIITDVPVDGFRPLPDTDYYYAPLNDKHRDLSAEAHDGTKLPWMLGYKYPAPPGIKPYPQQAETAEFMLSNHRAWILNEMRSGKTLSTIWAMDRMFSMQIIKKVLILSPLSIMRPVWQRELFGVMPQKSVYIADDSIEDAVNNLTYMHQDIVIMNHDKLRHCDELLDKWDPCLIVADEAGAFRAFDSSRVNSLKYLTLDTAQTSHRTRRRFLPLTATPCPQSPLDLWSLAQIVNPSVLPATYTTFRDKVMHKIKGKKGQVFYKPKPNIEPYVQSCLEPAIRIRTGDCIALPDRIDTTRHVVYTDLQKRQLKQMLQDNRTLISDVVSGNTQNVTAANAAVAMGKYLQICGGVVLHNGAPKIAGALNRVNEIKSVVNELGPSEKVIVMCSYTNIQGYLSQQLDKSAITNITMNGSFSGKQRADIVDKFQSPSGPRVIILHPTVGKWGLNLSAANTTIWYLPVYSADEFIQGNARMVSAKSDAKQKTGVIKLSGSPVEDMLYQRIADRASFQETVTSAFDLILKEVR